MNLDFRKIALNYAPRMAQYRRVRSLYELGMDPVEIVQYQTSAFNEQWKSCISTIPFYRRWASEHGLPSQISDIGELKDFPVLSKTILTSRFDEVCEGLKVDGFYSTGGSTGTPTKFPKADTEAVGRWADVFAARAWCGLEPGDKYIHLWGHSHLYGAGVLAKPKKAARVAKDWLVGGTRLNAYDLSGQASESYAWAIGSSSPRYVLGYTSALVRVASAASSLPGWAPPSSLRAAIVTAETASAADIELIERVFNVPCYVEYGAAETGVIAYSRPGSRDLISLWASQIVTTNHQSEVVITTIRGRLFPLINYEIGDKIRSSVKLSNSVLEIEDIEGRAQESVTVPLAGGGHNDVSAIMIVHICKALSEVTSVQVANDNRGRLQIFYTSVRAGAGELDPSSIGLELRRSGVSADESKIELRRIERPVLSRAGKVKVLLTGDEVSDVW